MGNKGLTTALKAVILIPVLFGISAADNTATREGDLEQKGAGRPDFVIEAEVDLNGKIQVITNPAGHIKITYKITAIAESKSEAERFLDLVDVKLDTKRSDKALLKILAPSHVPWGGTRYGVNARILLEIPEKIDIDVRSRFMDLEIVGPFQDINLDCRNSSISLNQIYGSVRIVTANSNIGLNTIRGDIRVKSTNGAIRVSDLEVTPGYAFLETTNGVITIDNVRGPVEAYTSYSSINVDNIDASEGSVVLRTNYAPINVSNVSGEIICETNYYPITIENTDINHGHSKIETSYAPIKAQIVGLSNCEVYISSEYNNIQLKIPSETSARLVASVDRGGNIHTKGIALIPTILEPTRLEGILGEGESRLEIKVNGVGNIDINGR